MNNFIARYADKITGVLKGFDRLVLRGTLRQIAFVGGMMGFLWKRQVLLKNFGAYAKSMTEQLKEASLRETHRLGRRVKYLPSSRTDKEAVARKIAEQDGITKGLIAVLECVEPCMSFEVHRNRNAKRLELVPKIGRCKFLYHYVIDPVFGFMNARIQTWFPFSIQICLNGREWLARQMDRAGISYTRRDNTFTAVEDVAKVQKLFDRQLKIRWPAHLRRIARRINPAHGKMFRETWVDYYWSAYQSEWATDIMFKDAASLAEIYPGLIRHAITNFGSDDVMRFLGKKLHGNFEGEVVTDLKRRPEGVRIKHRVGRNSIKLYDKQGSVLRPETTINDPYDLKVFRPKEGDPDGPKAYRQMRKGIADLHRRAQISQKANERYLEALAVADTSTPLGDLIADICRPALWKGKRVRGLHPWSPEDLALFRAAARAEFSINGFRNRDLQALLYDGAPDSVQEKKRRSARVSRLIRMLRAHGLIRKVKSSYRYQVTDKGRTILAAVLTAHDLTLKQLQSTAA